MERYTSSISSASVAKQLFFATSQFLTYHLGTNKIPPVLVHLRTIELLKMSRRDSSDLKVIRSTVTPDTLVVDCLELMKRSKITQLVVVDEEQRPIGVIRQHDIVAAGMA